MVAKRKSRYASQTKVSVEKSKVEIEKNLVRYGATGFAYAWQDNTAMVSFKLSERIINLKLNLPDKDSEEFVYTEAYRNRRSDEQIYAKWEQACRQAWKSLSLIILAKLEAVEAGITTLEKEFLADLQLPDGKTVADHVIPAVRKSYMEGKTLNLLPGNTE